MFQQAEGSFSKRYLKYLAKKFLKKDAALDEAMAALRLTSAPAAFKPLAKTRSSAADGKPDAIVVVDPLSTGARLAAEAQARGFLIVRVMSQAFPDELLSIIPAACGSLNWKATVMYDAALTTAFGGFPSNGIEKSLTRRNKHPMGEAVRSVGLRAVKQKLCGSWADARAFCGDELKVQTGETGAWCVLKPCKSAGTDGVFIAKSLAEAEDKFGEIVGKENVFGETNAAVLVQEFMKGTEFVVDSVSVEGTHKCVAIWVYDKRPCNGAQFVYYSMDLYKSADGKREDALVKYVHGVTACGVDSSSKKPAAVIVSSSLLATVSGRSMAERDTGAVYMKCLFLSRFTCNAAPRRASASAAGDHAPDSDHARAQALRRRCGCIKLPVGGRPPSSPASRRRLTA